MEFVTKVALILIDRLDTDIAKIPVKDNVASKGIVIPIWIYAVLSGILI